MLKKASKDKFNGMEGGQQSIENLKQNKLNPGFSWVEVDANFYISGFLETPQRSGIQSNSIKQKHLPINLLWTECLCPSQNVHIEILNPDIMVFGGETLKR